MALTPVEEQRVKKIESKAVELGHLVKQAASKNMLNRLLVLSQEENKKITSKLDEMEEKLTTLLDLARKLQ